MKNIYSLFFILVVGFFATTLTAQNVSVTFRVTLKGTGKKLHAAGLRVTGDMNSADQANWNPAVAKVATLVNVVDSVYEITLKMPRPANDTIQFKFLNGDNWGNGTTDPTEDERGLAALGCPNVGGNRVFRFPNKTDTVYGLPIFRFNTCTQVRYPQVRFRVTVKGTGRKVHAAGLRVTGDMNAIEQPNWNPASARRMTQTTAVADSIFETFLTIPRPTNDTIQFKYVNGDNWGNGTSEPTEDERGLAAAGCPNAGGNRIFRFPNRTDSLYTLPAYRFNTCTVIPATGTKDLTSLTTASNIVFAPNPMGEIATLIFDNPNQTRHSVDIINVTGQIVRVYKPTSAEQLTIERGNLTKGLYLAVIRNTAGERSMVKFILE